jgi:hypothetical protein
VSDPISHSAPDGRFSWPANAAAAWALIFGIFHLVWASGIYLLLDPAFAARAFANPRFLRYDLLVAVTCFAAVPVALVLGHPRPWPIPRRLVLGVAGSGTLLLLLRSVGSIAQQVGQAVTGRLQISVMSVWELWFYVGAALFSFSVWRYWRVVDGAI